MHNQFLGLATSFGLAVALLAPSPALASDVVDVGAVDGLQDDLDLISEDVARANVSVEGISDHVLGMQGDLVAIEEGQEGISSDVQGVSDKVDSLALTEEERAAIVRSEAHLSAIAERLTSEPEPEAEEEAEEAEEAEEPPYIDIVGVSQLLMLNTACLAVLVGEKAFELLWSAIGRAGN